MLTFKESNLCHLPHPLQVPADANLVRVHIDPAFFVKGVPQPLLV